MEVTIADPVAVARGSLDYEHPSAIAQIRYLANFAIAPLGPTAQPAPLAKLAAL